MIIISIDIGIKNFAYVVLESNNKALKILDWGILKLCDDCVNASKVDLCIVGENIRDKCQSILNEHNFDYIVIENQIGQNAIRMKMVQGMASMFFIMKGYSTDKIINYNAVNKLKNFLNDKKKKSTYQERKKLSKELCSKLCESVFLEFSDMYKKSKKKDDLSDCLLQGIDFMKKHGEIESTFFEDNQI
jgi:Holliday junction resolvasome RuvABC endonuclease subunit